MTSTAVGYGYEYEHAPASAAVNTPTEALQSEVNAIWQTGAVSALAEVTTPQGRRTAHAGTANITTGQPVPPNAEFRIGSATKTFVATVILQLADEHRLSLNDPVARWLPGVVTGNGNDGTRITIRQLLGHTSGIYDYTNDLPQMTDATAFQKNRFRTYTPQQLVALAMQHPPTSQPGTAFAYSDTDYVLAGMIIQRVTGHSWENEVTSRIIRPLGLQHTVTPGTLPLITGPHAEGYANFGAPTPIDVTAFNPTAADASGSMISTTDDLTRFYTALIGGHLLSPTQLTAMETTIPAPELGPGVRYGLGLGWIPLSCGSGYYGHPGGIFGYQTWDGVTPNAQRAAVVSATGDGTAQTQQAITTLVDDELCGESTTAPSK